MKNGTHKSLEGLGLLVAVAVMLGSIMAANSAQAETKAPFSWKAQLGASTEDFAESIGSLCDSHKTTNFMWMSTSFRPIDYDIRYPVPEKATLSFGNWRDPVGGYNGFTNSKHYQSNLIQRLSCLTNTNQHIEATAWSDKVFDIQIEYMFCPPIVGCNIKSRDDVDAKLSALIGNTPVYTFSAIETLGPNSLDPYNRKEMSLKHNPVTNLLYSSLEPCAGIRYPKPNRCIIAAADFNEDKWHSITIVNGGDKLCQIAV